MEDAIMRSKFFLWIVPAFALAGIFFGCTAADGSIGQGEPVSNKPRPPKPFISEIAITPIVVDLRAGDAQRFTAKPASGGGSVSDEEWSVTGALSGDTRVDADGLLTVGDDETAGTFTVKASINNGETSAEALVIMTESGNVETPLEIGLSVTPPVITVTKGASQTFSAEFSGSGLPAGEVFWSAGRSVQSSFTNNVLTVGGSEDMESFIVSAATSDGKYGVGIVYVADNGGEPPGEGSFPENRGISVSPALLTLSKGGTMQFASSPPANSWSVEGAAASTVTDGGLLTVGDDETAGKFTVRAAGGGAYGTAIVTVSGNEEESDPVVTGGFTVEPSEVTVARGTTQSFSIAGNKTGGITWRVKGGLQDTVIDQNGLLAVGAAETSRYLTVRAEDEDANYATAIVTVVKYRIAGPSYVAQGGAAQFTAIDMGEVDWSVSGNNEAGTGIDAGGTLSAAEDETAGTVLTVTAVSQADPGISASAAVMVTGEFTVEPSAVTVAHGTTQKFSIAGYPAGSIVWQVTGGLQDTVIDQNGLLTVCISEGSGTLTVRATDEDANYAEAAVTVVNYRVVGASDDVTRGGTNQFTAIDMGEVYWSVSGNNDAGTNINAGGMLSVAEGETAGTVLTVTAVSRADADISAGAAVVVRDSVNTAVYKNVTVSDLSLDSGGHIVGAAYGGGVFVIGSGGGKIFYSEDRGENWTQVSASNTKLSGRVRGMAYGNGVFVAGSANGKISYSKDKGKTWTAATSTLADNAEIHRIRYLNGKFYAVTNKGTIAYSENGEDWTNVAGKSPSELPINDIAYNAGKFIIALDADGTNQPVMAYSEDNLATWTAVNVTPGGGGSTFFSTEVVSILYADGTFLAGDGNNGALGYDGTNGWIQVATLGNNSEGRIRDITYCPGKFVAVGDKNKIAISDDGKDNWAIYAAQQIDGYGAVYGDGRFIIVDKGKVHILGD
jgi:hypothetical protein